MKNSIFSSVLLFLMIASSCNKEKTISEALSKNTPEAALAMAQSQYDGTITITLAQSKNRSDVFPYGASVNGRFKNGAEIVSVGKLYFGQNEISSLENEYKSWANSSSFPVVKSEQIVPYFGQKAPIKFDGNTDIGYTAFDESIDIPDAINVTNTFDENFSKVIRGSGLTITWTPATLKEGVIMSYSVRSSNNSTTESYNQRIEDNGTTVIPWDVLKKFDNGSPIMISIYRFSADEFDLGKKKINIISYNSNYLGKFNLVDSK